MLSSHFTEDDGSEPPNPACPSKPLFYVILSCPSLSSSFNHLCATQFLLLGFAFFEVPTGPLWIGMLSPHFQIIPFYLGKFFSHIKSERSSSVRLQQFQAVNMRALIWLHASPYVISPTSSFQEQIFQCFKRGFRAIKLGANV